MAAAGRSWASLVVAVALGMVLAALGGSLGVLESFLHTFRVGWMPVGLVGSGLVNLAVAQLVGRGTRSRLFALIPGVAWLLAVIVLALGRPEGDIVVASDWLGYGYLIAGAAGAVLGVLLLPWYSLPAPNHAEQTHDATSPPGPR